jgi:hypothetical protein
MVFGPLATRRALPADVTAKLLALHLPGSPAHRPAAASIPP